MRILNRLPNKTNFKFYSYMEFSSQSYDKNIKTIDLKTCGQLYKELRRKHPILYRNSPINGLDVKVEYVDTLGDNEPKKDTKTIVAIHGNPGNHKHFSGLIDYFKDKPNVRIIAPNFPNFRLTRETMAFWHSNEERVQFVKDFLKAINVNEIDCLVCHSAGIHPASLIWSDVSLQMKPIMLKITISVQLSQANSKLKASASSVRNMSDRGSSRA